MAKTWTAIWIAVLSACVLASAGCVGSVKPYERGKLAKSKMQFNPDPEAALLEQHVFQYREGSAGGYGGSGGGCGCN